MNFRTRLTLVFALTVFVSVALVPGQTPSPTPLPTPSPVVAKQMVESLVGRIRERIERPDVRRGQIGVKIVSLSTGKVIFESNAEKYFIPASNMKNFTVATALEKLTPDYRLVTSVFAAAKPDPDGMIKGDLRIFGRGDISISYTFNDGDYFKGLDRLVDAIAQSGVKRIEGNLIADETYFVGDAIPGGWEWDDLQHYYGAEVSSLPINDNAQPISVKPGPVGYPCAVMMAPYNPLIRVINLCTTTAAGTARTLRVVKRLDQNVIEVSGNLPSGNSGLNGFVSVTRPAELFVALLKQRLEAKGISVAGLTRAMKNKAAIPQELSVEIARLESPPMSVIAARTMKPSQNMYTETLLWTLGEDRRAKLAATNGSASTKESWELGTESVKAFLNEIGVAEDGIIQYDGSGLSRLNLITPSAVVQLYTFMAKQSRYSQAWRDSLTIGGVDGTLRNRFTGTKASGNVRGKTGTIMQVSALSGYVTTAAGEPLVFSMVVNGVSENRMRVSLLDDIVVALANFDGKIDQ